MPTKHIDIMCYDLPTVSRFFRSCAVSIAIQQTTNIEWKTYRDSKVLNAVYAALFWKEPPGNAEVKTGTRDEIDRRTDTLHEQFLNAWIEKMATKGPQAAHEYVTRMGELREYARDAVQSVFREASNINRAVIGETEEAIVKLARIKLGAQVGVALIGGVAGIAFVGAAAAGTGAGAGLSIMGLQAGAGASAFGAVGAGHSITHSVLKNWENGPKAQLSGIAIEGAKTGISEASSSIAASSLENALRGQSRSQQIIKSAEGQIRKYSERLAQEGLRKKAAAKATNIVANSTAQVTTQKAAAEGFRRAATNSARVGMTIPVVFSAWDIWEAVADYRETVGGVR
jgi:hypothetical protein